LKTRTATLTRIETSCASYAAGKSMQEIAADAEVSPATIWRDLKTAKASGDIRASGLKDNSGNQVSILMEKLTAAGETGMNLDAIKNLFWPEGTLPTNWRLVISVVVNKSRKQLGVTIKCKAGVYYLS